MRGRLGGWRRIGAGLLLVLAVGLLASCNAAYQATVGTGARSSKPTCFRGPKGLVRVRMYTSPHTASIVVHTEGGTASSENVTWLNGRTTDWQEALPVAKGAPFSVVVDRPGSAAGKASTYGVEVEVVDAAGHTLAPVKVACT